MTSVFPKKRVDSVLERAVEPVEVKAEGRYTQIGIRSHGKGLFDKPEVAGEELGNKRVFWVIPDCFVVNIVFAWEQAVGKTTDEDVGKIASHRFPMYRPKPQKADVDFITYLFKTKLGKHLLTLASPGGAGRNKTLGQAEFARIEIPCPPYFEQKRIAEILSTWDQAIETTEKLIANSEAQKKALMQQLLTGKKRLPGFTGEWKEFRLGEIGGTYSGLSGKSAKDFGAGCFYVQYKNVFENEQANLLALDRVLIGENENQNTVEHGDFIFTTSSETPKEVGVSSVVINPQHPTYLNSFCFGYRIKSKNAILPEFGKHFFRSALMRRQLHALAQGSTRYNLSKAAFLNIRIRLPDIDEQRAIAIVLEAASGAIIRLSEELTELKLQKSALMQQLLTGKRRVKVDKEVEAA